MDLGQWGMVWGGSGMSWERGNGDHNVLYEKKLFSIKAKITHTHTHTPARLPFLG